MENRCHECGYENELYAPKCSKCGASFEETISRNRAGMNDIRAFSILYIVTSAIGTGELVYRYLAAKQFTYGIFSGVPSFNAQLVQNFVTPLLYTVEIVAVVTTIVTLISIIYLRKGFKVFSKRDNGFSSPVTGTTLVFIGLAMLVLSLLILVAELIIILPGLVQTTPAFNAGSLIGLLGAGLLALVAAVILIIGVIMGILLGLHRLALKFDESLFEVSWILYLISFFFAPLGLVAGYLSYAGSNRTSKRLGESISTT